MRWVLLLPALVVSGCSTDIGPSQAELKQTWESQNVFPIGYKADLLAYLRTYLNNPTGIRAASVSQPQRKTIGPGERYVVCVRYNARKSDGQYAGQKEGAATYVSGKLDRFFDLPREVHELCNDATFGPFPELEKITR